MKEDAKVLPPTAEDQVIEPEEVVEVDSVTVQPLDDATNPGGLVDDLVVTLEGPNASRAEVTARRRHRREARPVSATPSPTASRTSSTSSRRWRS